MKAYCDDWYPVKGRKGPKKGPKKGGKGPKGPKKSPKE